MMVGGLNWPDLANYSTALSPVLAAIAVVGRVLWKKISHELTPNSGSSLRDAVDRIEADQRASHQELKAAIGEVNSELKAHMAYHKGQESTK